MSRRDQIEAYLKKLRGADKHDQALFHTLVQEGADLLGVTDGDIAEGMDISQPTAARWRKGISAPHPLIRPLVYAKLEKLAIADLKSLNTEPEAPATGSKAQG